VKISTYDEDLIYDDLIGSNTLTAKQLVYLKAQSDWIDMLSDKKSVGKLKIQAKLKQPYEIEQERLGRPVEKAFYIPERIQAIRTGAFNTTQKPPIIIDKKVITNHNDENDPKKNTVETKSIWEIEEEKMSSQ
jgi:hypothetical protein